MKFPGSMRWWLGGLAATVALQAQPVAAPAKPAEPNYANQLAAQLQPVRTVIYKRAGGQELRLDVFLPAGFKPGDHRPGLVAFHGGGWAAGDPRSMYPFATWAAARGQVGLSVQYRRYKPNTANTVFESVKDARSALRYVRSHAAELGLDPQHLVTIGSSAGGHLAVATALFDGVDEPGEDPGVSCRPEGVIMFSPVIDTSAAGYGQAKIGDRWRELSPLHQVRAGLPPMLLFHGTSDETTPFAGAQAFHEAMLQAGNRCDFVVGPRGRHVYAMKVEADFKDALQRIEAFLVSLGWPPAST